MSGWISLKIKDAPLQLIDGDRSGRYPKREEFVNAGVVFLNANSITGGRFNIESINYITEEKYDSIRKGRVEKGDLILTTRGNGVGDASYYSGEFGRALINAQMIIIRTDIKRMSSRFLYYLLSSNNYKEIFKRYASGSAQPQLPMASLKEIELNVPPISIQQKIASILSAYDDLIENNLKRIKLLEEAAQHIYKEWFVHFRFPGHEDAEFEDGLQKGWEKAKLGQVTTLISRGI